jgi:hypothetical protein
MTLRGCSERAQDRCMQTLHQPARDPKADPDEPRHLQLHLSGRGGKIVRTVASPPGGAYALDELQDAGVTDSDVGAGDVPDTSFSSGVGRRPDRHPAASVCGSGRSLNFARAPSELRCRNWPCGQNPGRKPATSRSATARETQEPRRTGFDLRGQLSLCRPVRAVRSRHPEPPVRVLLKLDAPRGVRTSYRQRLRLPPVRLQWLASSRSSP